MAPDAFTGRPVARPAVRRVVRAALAGLARRSNGWPLLLLLAWLAAVPPVFAVTPRSPTVDVRSRILELESQGRASPVETAQALERLRGETNEYSPQRLELLTVQGLMLAVASQSEAAERSAAQLAIWGRGPNDAMARTAAAAAWLIRARATARGGDLPGADALMREAMERLPDSVLPRMRYRFVSAQGYIKDQAGKLEDAVRLNHEALALADQQDTLWVQSEARISLAGSYSNAKQYERARTIVQEALALSEKAQDWVSLARGNNTAAIVCDGLGDTEGKRRGFELAIAYARRAGAKYDEVRYLANLADFYLQKADYKTALALSEEALPLARGLKDVNTEMISLANIGLAHVGLQHIEVGKRYVRESIAIDERRGAVNSMSDTWNELGEALEKAGDPAGAVAAFHEHRRLDAGLLRADEQRAILAMQEQYDADHRSRALVLLNRENEIKAEQLRRGDLQQRLWWLLAAAFVLSFAVVALLYRRVRQNNALLSSSNERLKVQSERDPLTGLANRRHFQTVMRQWAADGKLSGTVYLIDIDHFKQINDRHGHSTGDAVLVEVAKRLRETLREQDLIVRWGGEEFLVVVQGLSEDQVDVLAQRLLGALDHAPVIVEAHRVPVTGSIGFATFPIGPEALQVPWERAINLVDTAMYLAKAHGRNRAYGVRLLRARDEAALEALTLGLEAACQDGQAELTLLQGQGHAALQVAA